MTGGLGVEGSRRHNTPKSTLPLICKPNKKCTAKATEPAGIQAILLSTVGRHRVEEFCSWFLTKVNNKYYSHKYYQQCEIPRWSETCKLKKADSNPDNIS